MSKHTPGPLVVRNGTDVFTELGALNADGMQAADNDGWYVADCMPGTTSLQDGTESELSFAEQAANARLIAAAPGMLKEINKQIRWLKHIEPRIEGPDSILSGVRQSIKYLTAVADQAEDNHE